MCSCVRLCARACVCACVKCVCVIMCSYICLHVCPCVCVCVSQKFLKPAGSRSQPLGRARPPPAGSLGLGPLSHRPPDYVHTLLPRCRPNETSMRTEWKENEATRVVKTRQKPWHDNESNRAKTMDNTMADQVKIFEKQQQKQANHLQNHQ